MIFIFCSTRLTAGSGLTGIGTIFFYSYQPVKVIWHETICNDSAMGFEVLDHLSQEILIISFSKEYRLAIIPTIVNVIPLARFKFHNRIMLS